MTKTKGYITYCFAPSTAWWIRVGKLILHAKRSEPLFSERNGYIKFTKVPFSQWRVRLNRETNYERPLSNRNRKPSGSTP